MSAEGMDGFAEAGGATAKYGIYVSMRGDIHMCILHVGIP